jgi:hypothetical protein
MQHTKDLEGTSRRSFLLSTGSLFTTAWLGTQWAAITAAARTWPPRTWRQRRPGRDFNS